MARSEEPGRYGPTPEELEEVQEDLALVYLAMEESSLENLPLVLLHEESLLSMVRFAVAGAQAGEYQPEELPYLLREWCKLAADELPGVCYYDLAN